MKRTIWGFLVVAYLVPFVSCATPYRSLGFVGGYSEKIGDYELIFKKTREAVVEEYGHEVLYEVQASGNAYASEARIRVILLGRCGELALQNGCDYFYILESDSGVSTSTEIRGTTYGARATSVNKHLKYALIILSKGMIEGQDYPYNAQRYYDEAMKL